MKEKIKSLILLILVLNSLFLSWLLIFNKPNDTNISLSEYIPRLSFGQDYTLKQVIQPREFVIHTGDNKHSIIKSDQTGYQKLVNEMGQWSFYDFSQVNERIDWTEMLENREGIELVFPVSIPNSLLQSMFKVMSSSEQIDSINRIWIYNGQNGYIQAYFISDEKDQIFKAQISISDEKLNQYLFIADNQPEYQYYRANPLDDNRLIENPYYLPSEGINVEIQRKSENPVAIGDFIQLLFIDSSIVKKIEMDNENNILFTDGNRSMQYFINEKYISFFQPVSENKKIIDINKDIYAAIRYVNQHGGWDGDYLLDQIVKTQGSSLFQFREYIDGYPLANNEENYGIFKLKTTDGIISSFDRSIILLENRTDKPDYRTTYSSIELMEILRGMNVIEEDVKLIELNYIIKKNQDHIALEPYWIITLVDGEKLEILAYESVVQ